MRRLQKSEFHSFLRLIDEELSAPCRVVVIGGAAISLAFKGRHATTDLDLWSVSPEIFWKAVEVVNQRAALPVPVQKATIAEPPYNFEERLRPLRISGLRWMSVFVPEAHDLVLLKTARAEAHDLDAIEEVHRAKTLDLDTLIERYHETKNQVMGPPNRFRLHFLAVVARLFGDECASEVERQI